MKREKLNLGEKVAVICEGGAETAIMEMLIILNEGKYDQFKKSGKKPSEYCKQFFKNENLKSRKWVKDYFKNIDDLVRSIRMYNHVSDVCKGEYTLLDLLINEKSQ